VCIFVCSCLFLILLFRGWRLSIRSWIKRLLYLLTALLYTQHHRRWRINDEQWTPLNPDSKPAAVWRRPMTPKTSRSIVPRRLPVLTTSQVAASSLKSPFAAVRNHSRRSDMNTGVAWIYVFGSFDQFCVSSTKLTENQLQTLAVFFRSTVLAEETCELNLCMYDLQNLLRTITPFSIRRNSRHMKSPTSTLQILQLYTEHVVKFILTLSLQNSGKRVRPLSRFNWASGNAVTEAFVYVVRRRSEVAHCLTITMQLDSSEQTF